MAQVVSAPPRTTGGSAFWQVDRLFLAYLGGLALLIAIYFRRVPEAALLLAAHAAGMGLIVAVAKAKRWKMTAAVLHNWYPLAYIPICYKEMSILIPPIRRTAFDAQIASLDYRIWGAHPTVWLERLQNPWVTEILQIVYTLFIPSLILLAAAIWMKGLRAEFRYYAFLIAIGFLASYVGYLLVPVRGPRFFLAHVQHLDLHGVWLFDSLQQTLNRLESAQYDCFPSGHTELTVVAWWTSRVVSKRLFAVFSLYMLLIVSATVYLRYHYTVDVFAGIVLAAAVLALSPVLYAGVAVSRPSSATTT